MKITRESLGRSIGRLSRRERLMLAGLLAVALFYGADFLVSTLYLDPRHELREEIIEAEARIRQHRRLLAREELIHAEFARLESGGAAERDSILTETGVLRDLSRLAGNSVRLSSVVPRAGHYEGRRVLTVALDFEGSLASVVGYLEKVLRELPSEVGSLSLAPRLGEGNAVVCRMSLRVDGLEF